MEPKLQHADRVFGLSHLLHIEDDAGIEDTDSPATKEADCVHSSANFFIFKHGWGHTSVSIAMS